jgi:hypothetical protein
MRSRLERRCYSSTQSELVRGVSGPRVARSVQKVAILTLCAWTSGSGGSRESCAKSAANRRQSRLYSRSLAGFDTTYPLDWIHLSHSAQGCCWWSRPRSGTKSRHTQRGQTCPPTPPPQDQPIRPPTRDGSPQCGQRTTSCFAQSPNWSYLRLGSDAQEARHD